MMSGPKLVNKQFNSPINLYSPQAIQETLDRQTQVLSNGAVGIDFKQLAKPANLQNSAVLRMLEEEEERKRAGKAGLKRVAWPPPPEDEDYVDFVEQGPVQAKTRGVGEYATYQSKSPSLGKDYPVIGGQQKLHPQVEVQVQVQLQAQAQPKQQHHQQQQQQQYLSGLRQPSQFQSQQPTPKSWAPVATPATPAQKISEVQPASPQPFNTWSDKPQGQIPQTPLSPSINTWNDKPNAQPQPFSTWNDHPQQTLIPVTQDHQSPQPSYQPHNAPSHFEPPASIITLRQEPPISQESAPVYLAQPAAINPNSGSMRGDQKWPPASVKEQTEVENQARIELAKGPVFRPRRVNKDYSGFFAQHASTNNYPGYRAPPGTQYFTPAYQH